MTNLNTIQKDTAELLPEEQQIVFDLINLLRKRSRPSQPTNPPTYRDWETDRKSTRLNSSHLKLSRMPSSA